MNKYLASISLGLGIISLRYNNLPIWLIGGLFGFGIATFISAIRGEK